MLLIVPLQHSSISREYGRIARMILRTLKNAAHYLEAQAALLRYGNPSKGMYIIGVTGTDGKTTTSTLIYWMLKEAGYAVALVSTVAAYIGNEEIDTGFHVTNPSPFALQKLLRRVKDKGIEYVVLEITSHGIDQHRNVGIHPEIALITNVTHEHLDYHKTFENYLQTKAKLLTSSKYAILNHDATESYDQLKAIVEAAGTEYESVRFKQLHASLRDAAVKRFGSATYNLENVSCAAAVGKRLGIERSQIASAIRSFPGVKGRMQIIPNKRKLNIIVDFAHTPNALEQILKTVRTEYGIGKSEKKSTTKKGTGRQKKGKLILVFGCAGLRDHTKRPLMGDIASRLADLAIFTAEDPRIEDVWSIIAQMKSGVKVNHDRIVSIADREAALSFALELAKPGDTILVTGKGHETSMCFGTTEFPWNDADALNRLLDTKEK